MCEVQITAVPEFTTQELATEEWRDVPGYEGVYSVSNLGRVRRDLQVAGSCAGRILREGKDSDGYPRATLCKNNRKKVHKVHHLIAEIFIGPRPEGYTVNHIDGVKSNNRHANLEYCTNTENLRHAFNIGLMKRWPGEQNGMSKLTSDQVRAIRSATSHAEARALAKGFGIKDHNIYQIRAGRRWKHL